MIEVQFQVMEPLGVTFLRLQAVGGVYDFNKTSRYYANHIMGGDFVKLKMTIKSRISLSPQLQNFKELVCLVEGLINNK